MKILKRIYKWVYGFLIIYKGHTNKVFFYQKVYDKKGFTSYKNKKVGLGSLPARYIRI